MRYKAEQSCSRVQQGSKHVAYDVIDTQEQGQQIDDTFGRVMARGIKQADAELIVDGLNKAV